MALMDWRRIGEGFQRNPLPWAICLALAAGVFVSVWPPLSIPPNFESYDGLGWNLAQGAGFTFAVDGIASPYYFRTPGYPLFLAGLYAMFGHWPPAVYAAQVVLHGLSVVLLFLLARACLDRRVAALSACLVAVFPVLLMYIPMVLPEILSAFLVSLSLWLILAYTRRERGWILLVAGAVMGCSALVRPALGLFSVFCFFGLWLAGRAGRRPVRVFLLLHLGVVVVMAPWAVRNYALMGRFLPLTTEAPLQFWLGTLNVGAYANRAWENPNYTLQTKLLESRLKYIYDEPGRSIPIEARTRRGAELSPLRLHYWTQPGGRVSVIEMGPSAPEVYTGRIPPQPMGTRVNYYLTFRDPISPGRRIRYPYPKILGGAHLWFKMVPDVFGEIGEREATGLSEIGLHLDRLYPADRGAGAPGRVLYSLAKGRGELGELDVWVRDWGWGHAPPLHVVRVETARASAFRVVMSSGGVLVLPRKGPALAGALRELVRKGDAGGKLEYAGRVAERGPAMFGSGWRQVPYCGLSKAIREKMPGEKGIPGNVRDERAVLRFLKGVPCLRWVGLSAIEQELRRNRAYRALAKENLGRDFFQTGKAALLRIPRLWMVVSSGDGPQAYPFSKHAWVYRALKYGTFGMLVLGILGFVLLRDRWRSHWLLAVPVVYLSLVHMPFHAEGRYTLQGRAFLLVYGVAALMMLWRRFRGSGERP